MKKIIITIISIIMIFIGLSFLIAYFIYNNGTFLTNFDFKSVTNTGLNYYVYFDESKSATNYDILVYNSSDEIIYKDNIKDTSTTISFESLVNNEAYKIIVIAYDKDGNKKSIKEPYIFLWDELTFSKDNAVLMNNNEDYKVKLVGDYKNKEYILQVKENGIIVDTQKIDFKEYIINNKEFKDLPIEYTLEIIDNSMTISTLNIYNLTSPIEEIKFLSPNNGDMLEYNDVAISFEGGNNATNYLLELYRGKELVRRKEIKSKNIILSNNLFEKAATYKVRVSAAYLDYVNYSKTSEIEFTISDKETLKPVYTNYSEDYIKSGTKIKLLSPNENATIYYTLDGSIPNKNSIKYDEEIQINKNETIKAIAIEDKKNDSVVSEFNFKVGTKNNYKVYLSASNQYNNLGVSEVGYTNEKKEMNDLTNYIEKRLKSYGVTTYRNEFGDINRWTADSTYLGVDLHLAIHSNASEEHTAYGIETWVENETAKTYSLAQNIQNSLMNIYYNKEDIIANRGVKYARGSLGEVNPLYTPCGILIEVAHHDYKEDAKWIMDNKERIGNEIADTILRYFQIL